MAASASVSSRTPAEPEPELTRLEAEPAAPPGTALPRGEMPGSGAAAGRPDVAGREPRTGAAPTESAAAPRSGAMCGTADCRAADVVRVARAAG